MLSKIIGALPTSTLNALFDAAFDELKRRGEIIEDEPANESNSDKIKIYAHLAGLKQISSPNKAQTGFVSRKYVPIFVQPFDKPKRYRCPKRFQRFCKGV